MPLFERIGKLGLGLISTHSDEGAESIDDNAPDSFNKKLPFHRMRNIFAAPLDLAKERLDDLKDLIVPKNEEQYEFLNHAFEQHFIFQHLSAKEKKYLIGAMVHKSFAKGTTIIEQGTKGENLYCIEKGSVRFIVDGVEQTDRGEAGTVFGELSLLYDCPTAASVIAETDCMVWRVSQMTFRRIKHAYAHQGDKTKRDAIVSVPFFKDLPNDTIYQLAGALKMTPFHKGNCLGKKGDEGRGMYIMAEGHVVATDVTLGGKKLADVRMGPGEHFGERAIVTGEPYIATVNAETDGAAWFLSKVKFQQHLGRVNLTELVLKAQDRKLLVRIRCLLACL